MVRFRDRIAARALWPLAALWLAACGGGGGAPTGSLEGRLTPERSPSSARAASGEGIPLASLPAREREPNDHLFSAGDLGNGAALRAVAGTVGGPGDPTDLFRLGPCATGGAAVRLRADGARLACFEIDPLGHPCSVQRLASSGTIFLRHRQGAEYLLRVAAGSAAAYRIEAWPEDSTAAAVPPPVDAAAREEWRGVFAVETLLQGEIVFCREQGLDAATQGALGLTLVAQGGPVQRWRMRAALPDGDAGRLALADVLRAVRRACPDAAYVSPNVRAPLGALAGLPPVQPNDPLFDPYQFNLTLAGFRGAWDVTTGRDDVAVAVMDTGILPNHPDLAPRISDLGYDFLSDSRNAGDGDGVDPDPSEPEAFNFLTWFHGTYVAGILGAVANNRIGIAGGVWRGKIMPIRIFGQLGGTSFDRVQAMRYLAGLANASGRILKPAERPRVVNMSFASRTPTAAEKAEIENLAKAGILLVAAVGNDGLDPSPPIYPAAWPEVVGVGAVDRSLKKAPYSNVAPFVDVVGVGGTEIAGPGGVISTWALRKQTGGLDYVYNTFVGTSVAAPSVTAAVALMVAVHPNLEDATLRTILARTSLDLGSAGRDDAYGHGLLQADAAVRMARQLGPPIAAVRPASYDLGDRETEAVLKVENDGGHTLGGLTLASAGSSSGALSMALEGTLAPTRITARLDRGKVKTGSYRDVFLLRSNGGTVRFDLTFRKLIPEPPSSLAVRVYDGARLVAATTTAASGRFEVRDLAFGRYRLEAGVDRDRNGRLGDREEWFLQRVVEVGPGRTSNLGALVVPWRD